MPPDGGVYPYGEVYKSHRCNGNDHVENTEGVRGRLRSGTWESRREPLRPPPSLAALSAPLLHPTSVEDIDAEILVILGERGGREGSRVSGLMA